MDQNARVAFVNAQVACMLAELEAMKAENRQREIAGHPPAYGNEAFMSLQERYLVGHNAVISYLREY